MAYQIITETAQLNVFCEQISQSCNWVAVDTEFVRTDTYFPELSLIQIQGCNGLSALIDPLTIDNLSSIWQLLCNQNILKVFHAARQDLEILYQVAGELPGPIFDTQIAAVFLKYGATAGLASVVKGELGIELPKDQTRTNWHQRPLTEAQMQYAINDVIYLSDLYEHMLPKLSDEQLAAINEDFQQLLRKELYQITPHKAGEKLKPAKKLPPKAKAICYRLAEWREAYAIDHNKPKRWTIGDDAIVAIAKRPPKELKALYKVPGLKNSSIKAFGEEWIELIDDVFAHPELWPEKTEKTSPPSAQEEVLLSLGQAICQQLAVRYNIDVAQIINKSQLLKIIRHSENTELHGWRRLLFEVPFKRFLRNEVFLKVIDNEVVF